jgi:hypothetical protein
VWSLKGVLLQLLVKPKEAAASASAAPEQAAQDVSNEDEDAQDRFEDYEMSEDDEADEAGVQDLLDAPQRVSREAASKPRLDAKYAGKGHPGRRKGGSSGSRKGSGSGSAKAQGKRRPNPAR